MKKRVAILASGGGSNAQVLLDAMKNPGFPAEAVLVLSNRASAGVLERGQAAGVRSIFLNPAPFPKREDFDAEVLRLLREVRADIVCLAGYMRILTPGLVQAFAGRMLNVHPALLPKFGGPGMYGHHVHEAVLKAGEKESGASVHLVTEGVDEGQVLMQARCPVLPGDTADSLAVRVLEQEHKIYPQALSVLAEKL